MEPHEAEAEAVAAEGRGELGTMPPELTIGSHAELAKALLAMLMPVGPEPIFDEGTIHCYVATRGTWEVVTHERASRELQRLDGTEYGKNETLRLRASDVTGGIKLAQDRVARPGWFVNRDPDGRPYGPDPPRGIAFSDGFVIVGVNECRLVRHDPAHRARHGYAFPYQAEAHASKWLAFLADIWRDDEDRDAKIRFLQEFMGACLLGLAPQFRTALFLLGGGKNGKSTLLRIIEAMMPPRSLSTVAPHLWGHEYYRANLAGKRLNVVAELPERELVSSEAFKAIIAGDPIAARHPTCRPFTLNPAAGHIFAANTLPPVNDMTDGFWDRVVLVEFNRRFQPDEAIPDFHRGIIEAELPGIVSWAIEGARRLLARGRYEVPPSADKCRARWRIDADPVALFLEERTRPAKDGEKGTAAAQLFDEFDAWRKRNQYQPMSSRKFYRRTGMRSASNGTARMYPVTVMR
ncbi:DNA primase family protein, partial [Polyangium jinanense]